MGLLSHKQIRIRGGLTGFASVSSSGFGPSSADQVRQHDGSGLYQSAGGNAFFPPVVPVLDSLPVGYSQRGHTESYSSSRCAQRQGRRSPPPVASLMRVGTQAVGFSPIARKVSGFSGSGPVRVSDEQSTSGFLQSPSTRGSVAGQCVIVPLEGERLLRFSSSGVSSAGASEDRIGPDTFSSSSGPVLANQTLVLETSQASVGTSFSPSVSTGPLVDPGSGRPASEPPDLVSSGLAPFRDFFLEAGFSQEAALMAAEGRRPSTLGLYNRRLRLFREWCSSHPIRPSQASLGQIADFLLYLFQLGRKVNTIRGYRSAIAAIHSGFSDGGSVSDSASLNHLLKGMFLKRPTVRSLVPPWSLASVLETLAAPPFEPLHACSLKLLTLKTVFLVSLASGRRRGAVQALSTSPGHISFLPHGVRLVPQASFLAKNQT